VNVIGGRGPEKFHVQVSGIRVSDAAEIISRLRADLDALGGKRPYRRVRVGRLTITWQRKHREDVTA